MPAEECGYQVRLLFRSMEPRTGLNLLMIHLKQSGRSLHPVITILFRMITIHLRLLVLQITKRCTLKQDTITRIEKQDQYLPDGDSTQEMNLNLVPHP